MLEFVHVDKTYKNKVCALNDCNFKIEQGEFVFLIGPSGAGKSTITKLILKEINPDRGKIYLYGEDITRLKARKVPKLRQSIGMVFQDFKLLENKTVYQNIKYVMQILGKSSSEIKSTIDTVLDLVNLKDKKNAYPHELSGALHVQWLINQNYLLQTNLRGIWIQLQAWTLQMRWSELTNVVRL